MHLLPLSSTANSRSCAQWYVPGLTKKQSKPFIVKKDRRTFTVAVFVQLGQRPIVVEVNPSHPEAAAGSHGHGKRTEGSSSAMTAAEYIRIITQSYRGAVQSKQPQNGTKLRARLQLLHDRHPAHTSTAFKQFAVSHNITALLLPAKAPDLSVLDYGVFAGVKNKWKRAVEKGKLNWEQQCKELVSILQNTSPDSYINALPGRIKKCIAAKGGHFE